MDCIPINSHTLQSLKFGHSAILSSRQAFQVPLLHCTKVTVNAGLHKPLMHNCLPPTIDSTTGCYSSTGVHGTRLFFANIQQRKALECGIVALNSSRMHCHTYRKYTRSLWITDPFLFRTYSGSHYRVLSKEASVSFWNVACICTPMYCTK